MEPIESSQSAIHHRTSGLIGTLYRKRLLPQDSQPSSGNMDWALCTIDQNKMRLSNNLLFPNGKILYPRNIAQDDPMDQAVIIHTNPTGIINGCVIGDHSLVALPGSKFFQRMWIVVLERNVRKSSYSQISRSKS